MSTLAWLPAHPNQADDREDEVVRTFFRSIPRSLEFVIVVLVGLGLPFFMGLLHALNPPDGPPRAVSDSVALVNALIQAAQLSLVVALLHQRDWAIRKLAPRPDVRGSVVALGILASDRVLFLLLFVILGALGHGAHVDAAATRPLGWSPATVISLAVDALLEETIFTGYVLNYLESSGPALAIAVSTLLRLSLHLYQGWVALPSILSFGLVSALYYSRERQLWPPLLAHFVHNVLVVLQRSGW